jgi:hypothetical protein
VRTHAKVIKDVNDPDNRVNFFPLRWMQQEEDPATKTRAKQGLARTQKLFIVPQANVLSGAGQEQNTAHGNEDVGAEKQEEVAAAAKLVASTAAANAAADFEKTAAAEKGGAKTARTQTLWDASANDKVLKLQAPPKWSAAPVNAAISNWQAGADDQSDKYRGTFKSAVTQKLFIVPQANVLTGQGQEQTTGELALRPETLLCLCVCNG